MIPANTRPKPILALEVFMSVWSGLALDLAEKVTCEECEAICDLFEAFGDKAAADHWRECHSLGDQAGDNEEHLRIKAQLEREGES